MAEKETVVAVLPTDSAEQTEAEEKMGKEVTLVEEQANGITIASQEDYENAAVFGRIVKQKAAQITDFFAPMKKAAHDAHANICAREKQMLAPLVAAEKAVKTAMGNYIMEQERKRREEEERLRKLAQEEAERKLREAIALEEKGDKVSAAAALQEADIIDQAGSNVVVEVQKVKADGTSTSVDWEITEVDASKVPIDINGVCVRPVDEKAIIRLIRASKGQIKIPGITYKTVAKLAFRK